MTRALLLLLALELPQLVVAMDLRRPEPGSLLVSPSGECVGLVYEVAGTGSRAVKLTGNQRKVREVRDVLEMGWIDATLVIAVSPIYSKPGIYLWNCNDNSFRTLVPATAKSRAWPDGADFFRLRRFENGILEYEHAPNVDSPTLEDDLLRNRKTLRIGDIGK